MENNGADMKSISQATPVEEAGSPLVVLYNFQKQTGIQVHYPLPLVLSETNYTQKQKKQNQSGLNTIHKYFLYQ